MSLATLLTESVTVVRYAEATDEYGDEERGTPTSTVYPGRLEQLSSEEVLRNEDTVLADWRLFLPATADITAYDVVQARGLSFEVVGLPNEQRAPWGIHHVEARLKVVV